MGCVSTHKKYYIHICNGFENITTRLLLKITFFWLFWLFLTFFSYFPHISSYFKGILSMFTFTNIVRGSKGKVLSNIICYSHEYLNTTLWSTLCQHNVMLTKRHNRVFSWSFVLGWLGKFCKIVNIFTHTCSNCSGVSAIDSPDRFVHAFHPHCIQRVLENFFGHEIWIVRPQH